MSKTGFTAILFLIGWGSLYAAVSPGDTLIDLPEVRVVTARHTGYAEDLRVTTLDSAVRIEQIGMPLDQLLQLYLPVAYQQYGGRGSLSTISLRGNPATQTQVLWNGFPLNTLTTGIADLSGIRTGFFSQVTMISGAPGSLYGSGTAGGAVELSNTPGWEHGTKIMVSTTPGSFHRISGTVRVETGNTRLHYEGSFTGEDALNDFRYVDVMKSGSPLTLNRHNRYSLMGMLHTLSLRTGNGNLLQAGVWAQQSSLQLPPIMGSYAPGFQVQRDSSLRIYASWEKRSRNSMVTLRTAWFTDGLRFTDRPGSDTAAYSIDSHIRSSRAMTDAAIHWFPGKHWRMEIGGSFVSARAVADAYGNPVHELRAALTAGIKFTDNNRITINLTSRQHFLTHKVAPQFSLGMRYILIPDQLTLRGRIYSHYKLPAFNDLYWVPGGNRNLKPEKGRGLTAGIDTKRKMGKTGNLLLTFDVYYNILRDQIIWVPGTMYWSPENLQQSKMYGLEQTATYRLHTGRWAFSFGESYAFTRSLIVQNNLFPELSSNTNPFIPVHTGNVNTGFTIGGYYGSLFESFYGNRFTTSDNQVWYRLEPYSITTVSAGKKWHSGPWEFSVQGMIHNLFNRDYQSVSARPMPRRSFSLQLKIIYSATSEPT